MEINLENADAYFAPGNHSQAQVWLKYGEKNREGALELAKRTLAREIGRELDEEKETVTVREDYAAFEQALWLLKKSAFSDSRNGDSLAVLKGHKDGAQAGEPERGLAARVAPEALLWLGVQGSEVEILRS